MPTEWFYQLDGIQVGPMTSDDLKNHAIRGRIQEDTLVRTGDNPKWYPACQVKGLLSEPLTHIEESHSTEQESSSDRTSDLVLNVPNTAKSQNHFSRDDQKKTAVTPAIAISVIGLVATFLFAFATKVGSPRANITNPPMSDLSLALQEDDETALHPEAEERNLYKEAKKVLLESFSSVGGTPRANVRKGIDLLEQHLLLPAPGNPEGAKLLLEHSKIATSDDMAITFIGKLGKSWKDVLENEKNKYILVHKSELESLSSGFAKRMVELEGTHKKEYQEQSVDEGGEDYVVELMPKASTLGEWQNSIHLAFVETLQKNVKRANILEAEQLQQAANERAAAREEHPKLTARIFDIINEPKLFEGKCIHLSGCKLYGDYEKKRRKRLPPKN